MVSPESDHSPAVCRASKHTRVQHLVTADEHSLAELQALIATLPICSTGRVFIEVPDASWISPLAVPPRMIVTWLDRSTRTGDPGSGRGCGSGQALARAVTAWAGEMLCQEDFCTNITLLGGYLGTADIFEYLTTRLGVAADSVHTPERFGLVAAE